MAAAAEGEDGGGSGALRPAGGGRGSHAAALLNSATRGCLRAAEVSALQYQIPFLMEKKKKKKAENKESLLKQCCLQTVSAFQLPAHILEHSHLNRNALRLPSLHTFSTNQNCTRIRRHQASPQRGPHQAEYSRRRRAPCTERARAGPGSITAERCRKPPGGPALRRDNGPLGRLNSSAPGNGLTERAKGGNAKRLRTAGTDGEPTVAGQGVTPRPSRSETADRRAVTVPGVTKWPLAARRVSRLEVLTPRLRPRHQLTPQPYFIIIFPQYH